MWNTSIALPALVMVPITLTLGPILSYNVLVLLGFALSGWCAFLAISRYVTHPLAALAGALLYEAGPFMYGQGFGHLNFVLAFTPPLLLLLLDELLVRQRRPAWLLGVLLGLLATAQLLITEELLASEALVAATGAALLVVCYPGQARVRVRTSLQGLAVAVVVGLVLVAAPLAVQFLGPNRVHGSIQPVDRYVSDLLSFVVPFGLQWLHPARLLAISERFTGAGVETNSYLGVPLLLVLMGVSVRRWSRPVVRIASLLLLAVALLSLGPHLHVGGRVLIDVKLPWRVVQALPIVANILPSRLALYLDLLAGLLLAVFVDLVAGQARPLRRVAGFAVAALVLVPLLPNGALPMSQASVPAFFTGAAVRTLPRGASVLVAPFARGPYDSDPMLWQAEAGMWYRMPDGYAIMPGPNGMAEYGPRGTATSNAMAAIQGGAAPPSLTPALRGQVLADLATWRVRAVIVGPMPQRDAMARFFSELFGRPPTVTGGVDLWTT
jgi:hypothetical protein